MILRVKFFLIGIGLIVLSGCATITPEQRVVLKETMPLCVGERDCEAKWSAAKKWLLSNASRKIQIYSDDLIETYNPAPNSPLLAARITKEPAGSGAYYIVPNVWCNNIFGCVPKRADAMRDFNNYVNSVAVPDDLTYMEALKETKYSKPVFGARWGDFKGKIITKFVSSNSPAAKAGLKKQDVVHQFNGDKIVNMKSLQDSFSKVNNGDEIEIHIIRNGQIIPLKFKFPSTSELEKIRQANEPEKAVVVVNDIETKLEALQRLLDKGLISQNEFNKKKTKLLEDY